MNAAFLFGLPGKVKTLLDRVTSTRAANLDKLDTQVSSRAPASTALSNSVWTNQKAGYLNAPISSIPTGIIKSIQSGFTTLGGSTYYKDITLGAVDTSKTLVFVSQINHVDDARGQVMAYMSLSTNLRVQISNNNSGSLSSFYFRYSVVEFY